MSTHMIVKELGAAQATDGSEARIQIPDAAAHILYFRVSGTFVGTLKGQRSADMKVFADGVVTSVTTGTQANPTAVGNYAVLLTAADKAARVIFSAYTSGTARIEAWVNRV